MSKKDWETDGYRNGDPIYCPVNAYGECTYCDQCNMCHIADPIEDCDDFASFFESWNDWVKADDNPCAGCPNDIYCRTEGHICEDLAETFAEDEIQWAGDVYGYEDTMEDNEE